MAFFRRGRKGRKGNGDGPEGPDGSADEDATGTEGVESSPQRVGVVSGVLSTTADEQTESDTLFGDVVARRFGPTADANGGDERTLPPQYDSEADDEAAPASDTSAAPEREALRVVSPLFPDPPSLEGEPALEVDPMAHIGRATTITGNIVAEEDLEIQGTVEGSVRLANHQVTVGAEGHVKASVDAEIVMVYGKVTGDIVASDLVEIEKGGIVGGDVKAPRIVMHDGAIVVGRLDMSAALPNGSGQYEAPHERDVEEDRPHLAPVVASAPLDATDEDDAE